MLKVVMDREIYKIRFERALKTDTTYCQIYLYEANAPVMVVGKGVAHLHPKDKYDKVIGKKVALTKALREHQYFDKVMRREVWIAFWLWVGSWGANDTGRRITCPTCRTDIQL